MGSLWKQYKQLSDVLLKPNKIQYDPDSDLLEPETTIKGVGIVRHDFRIENDDKLFLACHLFFPETLDEGPIDLVCFLHTRGGNALEGKFLLNAMLPNVAVLLLNFVGSGISDGEYVSLGMNETRDFKLVLDKAKEMIPVGRVCLWGRSMGAVTAIMFTKLWNNPDKFFVTKEEYIRRNQGAYKKYLKNKDKIDEKAAEEQEQNGDGAEGTDNIELNGDKSDENDMERDLLDSADEGRVTRRIARRRPVRTERLQAQGQRHRQPLGLFQTDQNHQVYI